MFSQGLLIGNHRFYNDAIKKNAPIKTYCQEYRKPTIWLNIESLEINVSNNYHSIVLRHDCYPKDPAAPLMCTWAEKNYTT